MTEPFPTGRAVHELGAFSDRADEVARVRRAIRAGERLLVYGERRIGKTSIVLRAAERERAEHHATVLWLDLWTLTTIGDMLRGVLAALPPTWAALQRLQALLATADLRPQIVTGPREGEIRLGLGWTQRELSDERARAIFAATLAALDSVATEHPHPVTVVFDEFQRIEAITPNGGAFLRGIIQHTGRLGYVMAGSMLALVDGLTAPGGPFYNIDRLDVGPIAASGMASWIAERMRANGVVPARKVGHAIVERAGTSTEARIKLARETFLLAQAAGSAQPSTVDRAFDALVDSMTSGYESVWGGLAEGHRRALQMLANSEPHPTAAGTLERYGVTTSSTVTRAIEALRERTLLTAGDPPRIADPFFAAWVRTRTLPPAPNG